MEDIEFRLKRGSELGRFDQFWDDDTLFECRYSRSKWLGLHQPILSAPLEIYSHALKGNKNIIHISFSTSFHDVTRFPICDLPWVTSVSPLDSFGLPAIHHGPLFIRSDNYDLITLAKEIRPKLDSSSTYIFTDADWYDIVDIMDSGELINEARVLISFVAPTSGQRLTLRLKHSGRSDGPLEITLGSTCIQLNPSESYKPLTIDDITLFPTVPFKSDHLTFKPGRNDIFIKFDGSHGHDHYLNDIELLDEVGLEDLRNQIINSTSYPGPIIGGSPSRK